MLSNPPNMSGLHSRQRQHRRQNSTPSAFEAVKIAPLPNFQQRPHTSHRRGLSLDTRGQQPGSIARPITPRPSYPAVSMSATNPGTPTTPQHVLREGQQQHTARPGPNMPIFRQQESDAFLMSPQVTFPGRQFGAEAVQGPTNNIHGLSLDLYSESFSMEYFGADTALSTPSFMTFPDSSPAGASHGWISDSETASNHSRRGSRRISNGILDKVAKFEALDSALDASSLQRPCTPNSQSEIGTNSKPGSSIGLQC
jgi:regulatory protein SWI5